MKLIYLYLLTLPVFFVIDMLWIGVLAKDFYRNNLGHLFRENINWAAALIFYFLYIIGILIFATLPAMEKQSLGRAVLLGALFGFFAYATYDLTNFATLKDWPLKVTVVDMIWGMVLTASVAAASYLIGRWLMP
ncbi:hypothetical protein ASZ90_007221 [hydrocarbon metagenome]|uniref:DUF2177 domain-containing protein n=1 Tax=hydrocarbon metagenome TaxID=938273 RepID=A0A0W8FQ42_9ZZZZ